MIINIKVDVNDGDFRYIKSEIDDADLHVLKKVANLLSKFRPYNKKICYSYPDNIPIKSKCSHNFPWGDFEMFGLNIMCRTDLGEKSAYELYVKRKKITQDEYDVFTKYLKKRNFHTIHQIKIDKEVIYKRSQKNKF